MCATPAAAQAGDPVDHGAAIGQLSEQQRARFGEVLGLAQVNFEQGDFERAITQLTEAYTIYPLPRILYKLAEAQERAGKLEDARSNYQLYLSSGDVTEDRARIQGLIANLDRRLNEPATLVLTSTPQGALVYINDQTEPVGATPLRYPLKPGTYTIRLEARDHEPNTFTLDARYGAELVLDKKLEEKPIKESVPVKVTPLARPVGLASAGLGVASGALLLMARAQATTLDDSYTSRSTSTRPGDLDTLTSRHNTLVVSAWVLGALSLAGSSWSVIRWKQERSTHITLEANPKGAAFNMELTF
jgi:hypothetical protein